MATPLTERTILMQPPAGLVVNESAITADTTIQAAVALTNNGQMLFGFDQARVFSGGNWSINPIVTMVFWLSASNDSTVAASIPTLASHWPGWTISTYSRNLVFG